MTPYKTLRFAEGKIPDGLLRSHHLKQGVRGELVVIKGSVTFVDHQKARRSVSKGELVHIAPTLEHHLEDADSAAIEIKFFRTDSGS